MSQMTYHQILTWVKTVISQKLTSNFYGTVSFRIEAGRVIHCKTEYTEKPTLDELPTA